MSWGRKSLAKPPGTEPIRRRLDITLEPLDVLRRFRDRERLVALIGAWHHGEALIAFDPTDVITGDPFNGIDLPPSDGEGFFGGWIGAWGYQLGRLIEELPDVPPRRIQQPDHRIAFYDHVLRLTDGVWWHESLSADVDRDAAIDVILAGAPSESEPYEVGTFEMTPTPQQHQDALRTVLDHIAAGDIFQANLCTRLESPFSGDPLDVFCAGVDALQPAYAAYVSSPEGALASMSPELFLRRTGDEVLTSPIKGTASLDTDPAELVSSAKNRAENIMIVDLMRNDLGRVSVPGSVRVPAITRAERHAVWHLVSDVVGHVSRGVLDSDLLRATFPPGSVTGAPKVRAMEIINELEATGREAYTGSIGHVSASAGLEMNVAIRTFEIADSRIWLGVGGGIVADSTPEGEYAECLVKARPLIEAIGGRLELTAEMPSDEGSAVDIAERVDPTVDVSQGIYDTLLVEDGVVIDIDAHLARLDASVRSVYGTTIRAGLDEAVLRRASGLSGRQRLRIDAVPHDGEVRVTMTSRAIDDDAASWTLEPRTIAGGFGQHKWSDRRVLEHESAPDRDLLLVSEDGAVLETARASVFVVHDDGVHTPPVDDRILPGTARARIIEILRDAGVPVFQRRLTIEDVSRATEVFVANSLRGVVPVRSVEGVGEWSVGRTTEWLRDELWAFWRSPVPRREAPGGSSATEGAKVLFIDNYDSFVYNLVQYVGELGATAEVVRNDAITVDQLVAARERGDFTHLIVSPGPGTPADAGISIEAIRRLGPTTPTLGVCLGHQAIGEVYGATVVRAPEIVHGKPSLVHHDGLGVYAGLPSPLVCARYHSLVIDPATLPDELEATAHTASGILMGVRHRTHPVEGVQMHPESILTARGHEMLQSFLADSRHSE
ncbi:para-aminobenzoate synthetase/4-amino-4-deoxychorismate lyase [Aeromicrobium panaciterrae]|uniref:Para-aminobenzoate synthetase/4-amino-4-deoxychorismate lyase n=1 Tax=Aeromicrobium panaciterrae TaxID=363861 RepID=A0ABU1UKI5_9ACTN|nr:chorismate-binding protein [Aeromicrobium panaciterrae]MDR7085665.1 para-aminobenzoate synthetase/4-amino-4-deoxychorismate lyase [Aeromicrobium panaciterrae]